MADLAVELCGVRLEHPFMNAAGPLCVTRAELVALAESRAGAVVTKSMTPEPRAGNPEPRYHDLAYGSLNSMGLPNLGYEAYCKLVPELRAFGKPLVASVAAFSLEGYVRITEAVSDAGFDLVEVNLSCPNVPGEPQVGYDFAHTEAVVQATRRVCRGPLGFKLPPYFDGAHQERAAAILRRGRADFVTLINSVGNALVIDPETESTVIHPRDGFGGLGGVYVKPVALANVRAFHTLLGRDVPVVGVGGIYTGTDAFEFLLAGATALQLGTVLMQEGTESFARIAPELDAVLSRKGYATPVAALGRLKAVPAAAPASGAVS